MITKYWTIEKIESEYINSNDDLCYGECWEISDGIKSYIYPCNKYTADQAWEAWENQIM